MPPLKIALVLGCAFLVTGPPVDAQELRFTKVATIFGSVLDIRNAGDGSGRLFLVGRTGSIHIMSDGSLSSEPFLDISDRVSTAGEGGLLSLAFPPDFAASGKFYVWYTNLAGDTVLSRFSVTAEPDVADAQSEQVVLIVAQPFGNHNGGRLVFGADGYLYLGLGDGGGTGDQLGNAQDMSTLLGKLIRIDVDPAHGTYRVPADNPFVNTAGAAGEIWAVGLRNPWRISVDRLGGNLFISDVGQENREEVNFQAASSLGGENYGWNLFEGTICFFGPCDTQGLTAPVVEYDHTLGCAITGGEVYRGTRFPNLQGVYLFGDVCSGRIWGLKEDGAGSWDNQLLADTGFTILTFGDDEQGNIYVSAQGEGIFRIEAVPEGPNDALEINPGLNDAWLNVATAGQGFFIIVFPDTGIVFLAWFTYDTELPPDDVEALLGAAEHRWLTAQGPYEGDTATLDVFLTEGGIFDMSEPAPVTGESIGKITIVWTDCEKGVLSYDIDPPGVMGEIPITRIVPDNVALCAALAKP